MKSVCPKCGGNAYLEKYADRWMVRNYQTALCPTKELTQKAWEEKEHEVLRNV